MLSCVNNDILHTIFIRLPVESLIRSRAVCKRWQAIIDEPPFARAHQHQHPINKSVVVIQTNDPNRNCYSLDLESLDFSSDEHQTIPATPLDYSDEEWYAVSACKGLVLTNKPFEIWNPLTNERLDIHLDLPSGHGAAAYGLGYDYIADDYKAVSILKSTCQTDVYSLKSDTWRTINTNCPRVPKKGPGVFVGGALNWLPSKADDNKIIALDVGTEKYTLLQMPPHWWDRLPYHIDIGETTLDVLGGCLILCAVGANCSCNGELVVWVMKDYGDEGSWIELFSIEQMWTMDGNFRPVGFIMRKEEEDEKMRLQVFLKDDGHVFTLFDVKTNTSKWVRVLGHYPYFYSQQMFPGTKFCLHNNCGVRGGTSTTSSENDNNSADLVKSFVFALGSASAGDLKRRKNKKQKK